MKKLKIFIALLLLPMALLGQTECDNHVSTKFNDPENTNRPINTFEYGFKFLNKFDWNQRNLFFELKGYQTKNMLFNQVMSNVMDPEQPNYYTYIYQGEQLLYENGWELLAVNLGTYPNLSDYIYPGQNLADVPYIILYNRYSGIIRIFANYGNGLLGTGISFDAVKIELTFKNDNVNGLYRLYDGTDQALDQKTDATAIVSIAKHPNSPGDWFSADFQVAYDPCVCNFPSKMSINFSFIQQESIVLQGRSVEVEDDLVTGLIVDKEDFLTGFDYTGGDTIGRGSLIIYRTFETLVNDYIAKLDAYEKRLALVNQHNEKIARNKTIVQMFQTLVLQGGSSAIDEVKKWPFWDDVILYANEFIGIDSVIRKKDLVKEAKNALAEEINLFFAKNFATLDKPTSPNKPRATFSEMVLKGGISNTTPIDGPAFYTPGTYGSEGTPAVNLDSPFEYPVYNDVLGTFALLETPKVLLSRKHANHIDKLESIWINTPGYTTEPYNYVLYWQRYMSWDRNYQFKLKNDLKYAINSNLDIAENGVEIKAAFKVKAKLVTNPLADKPGINNVVLKDFNTYNITSTDHNIENFYSKRLKHHGIDYADGDLFPHPGLDLNSPYPAESNDDAVDYITPFLPVNAFYQSIYGVGIRNEWLSKNSIFAPDFAYRDENRYDCTKYPTNINGTWCYPAPESIPQISEPDVMSYVNGGFHYEFYIELKLLVDITFKTLRHDGTPNTLTQIFTYEIDPNTDIEFINGANIDDYVTGTLKEFDQFPENLTITNTTFQGQKVSGCKLTGNNYTCRAWNDIILQGDIRAASGYQVNVIAGNEIQEINETVVEGEVVREIQPVLDYSHPMPQSTAAYVYKFCDKNSTDSSRYLANTPSPKALLAMERDEQRQIENNRLKPIDFTLYPNPTNETATVTLNQAPYSSVNIEIHDLTGKVQEVSATTSDKTNYRLNVALLADGIYFVKVVANGESKTKQLIIQ